MAHVLKTKLPLEKSLARHPRIGKSAARVRQSVELFLRGLGVNFGVMKGKLNIQWGVVEINSKARLVWPKVINRNAHITMKNASWIYRFAK